MEGERPQDREAATAPRARRGRPGTTRERWLATGLEELGRGGPGALRLEVLCRRLGVTKGSFYWHFDSRAAFLAALLEAWEARDTRALIEAVEAAGGSPGERLANLVRLANAGTVDFRTEQAIRHWGRSDPAVRAALHRVDAQRLDYMAAQVAALGLPPAEARLRAGLVYALILGEALVFRRETPEARRARQAEGFAALLPGAPPLYSPGAPA